MKNKKILITTTILSLILISSIISAFGVSSSYWDNEPVRNLMMTRGETQIVNLNIQNMVGDEDISVKAILKEGSEIADLKENTFNVKAKTHDTMAPLEIKIPKEFKPGRIIKIITEFKTLAEGENGLVVIGTGMTISFDVIVSEEAPIQFSPIDQIPWRIIGLIFAIILIILAIIIILRKRRRKMFQNQEKLSTFKK